MPSGIHHVTSIASSARRNLDFYERTLGLRRVKKTVNFDDPGSYHLYYGDAAGHPGTILTFFAWEGAAPGPARDRGDAGDRLQHPGRLDRLLDPAPGREGRRPRSARQALRRNNDRVQGSRRDSPRAKRRQGRRGQAWMERRRRARGTFHSRLPQREPAAG